MTLERRSACVAIITRSVELVERLPSVPEYLRLLTAVGWPSPAEHQCERALPGSLAAVCAVDGGEIVGMGRLVGDSGIYCFVVDLVVDRHHQGRGIGSAIMGHLEGLANERRLGKRLDLVAASEVTAFYGRLGYTRLDSDLMRKTL